MDKLVELINLSHNSRSLPTHMSAKLLNYDDSPYDRDFACEDMVLARWYVCVYWWNAVPGGSRLGVVGILDNGKALPFFDDYTTIDAAMRAVERCTRQSPYVTVSDLKTRWITYDVTPLRERPVATVTSVRVCVT